MIYHQILRARGITTFAKIDYGGVESLRSLNAFLHNNSETVPNLVDTIKNHELAWGYRIWPYADISDGQLDMALVAQAAAQTGCGQMGPYYPFGYFTQFYPIATSGGVPVSPGAYLPGSATDPNANINNQEYWLQKDGTGKLSLVLATSFGYPGVVISSPGLLSSFKQAYDQIKVAFGGSYRPIVALSDVPLADHPLNFGGSNVPQLLGSVDETSNSGGHNRNAYVGFVKSGFFGSQTNAAGKHIQDGSACAIFYLKGSSGFTGSAQVPGAAEAVDIDAYHKLGSPNLGVSDGYGGYLAASQATLEFNVRSYVDPGGIHTFIRTSIPEIFWSQVPGFRDVPKEAVLGISDAFALFQWTGGDVGTPYWNESNPGDNYSAGIGPAVGGIPFDNSASAQAVNAFYTIVVPNWIHHPIFESDSMGSPDSAWAAYSAQPPNIVRASQVPAIPHFGTLLSQMDAPAGFTGYEADSIRVLTNSHYFNAHTNFSPFGLVCHQWGWDSDLPLSTMHLYSSKFKRLMTLSDFQVIFWQPDQQNPGYAQDVASIKSYVQAGGNIVTCVDMQSGWDPSINDLIGETWASGAGGTVVSVQNANHPLWTPYSAVDIAAAFASFRGSGASRRTRTDGANITPLLTDPVAGDAAWVHRYGNGKIVVWPIHRFGDGFEPNGQGLCDGLASGLAYLVFNSIIWLGGGTPPGPYLPKFVERTAWAITPSAANNFQGGFSGLTINMIGLPGPANEKMVMISNATPTPQRVQVKFSAPFFGFQQPSYQLVDTNGGTVLSGLGDPSFDVSAPPTEWMTFYTKPAQGIVATTVTVTARPH